MATMASLVQGGIPIFSCDRAVGDPLWQLIFKFTSARIQRADEFELRPSRSANVRRRVARAVTG